MNFVLLGLGSNKSFEGKKSIEILAEGCLCLCSFLNTPHFSSIYETRPMYLEDQDNFYNAAVSGFIEDNISADILLEKIQSIEKKFGRCRSKEIRFGPRSLDIDIEEFGGFSISKDNLQIPHPRICERAFVLLPAIEILDEISNTLLKEKLNGYLKKLPDQGVKKCSQEIQMIFKGILTKGLNR